MSAAARARDPRPEREGSPRDPLRALVPDPFPAGAELAAPPEGLLALWLAAWAADGGPPVVHVARSDTRARRLAAAAAARGAAPDVEVLLLPPWDCLPYDRASPSRAVMGERMAALRRLAAAGATGARGRRGLLVLTTTDALLQRVPPREAALGAALALRPGEALDAGRLRLFLLGAGYVVDERVDEPGEAAIRGGAIDLYPADAAGPFRLDLAGEDSDGGGDRIAEIRRYDPLTQRTLEEVGSLELGPASELLVPEETLANRAAAAAGKAAGGAAAGSEGETRAPADEGWIDLVLTGPPEAPRRAGGGEQLMPLAYERMETLLDYLPPDARLVLDPDHEERREAFLEQVRDAHEARRSLARVGGGATAGVVLEPGRLYLEPGEIEREAGRFTTLALAPPPEGDEAPRLPAGIGRGRQVLDLARERLAAGDRVVLAAAGEADRRRLARLAERELGIRPVSAADLSEALAAAGPAAGAARVATVPVDLPGGFRGPGLLVLAAGEALGRRAAGPGANGNGNGAAAAAAAFLPSGLRPGDRVVHADHGVAVLRGLEALDEDGTASEHLALGFAGEDRLLVPALGVDQLWRYGSAESDVPLDRLEGEAWTRRRAEVEAELGRAARALAGLAAERARLEAPAFKAPPRRYARFAARFPFAETDDQARAIEAVLADLARGRPPMDRLVCGDVGFGKTEVALRAAAVAALAGRQVAVLAPTTVLVRQHLQTFRRRFADLGVRVEQLSRLAGAREAREVKAGLADGSVHVVVGTHALAAPDLRFKDLGLVIIDEEQRFGARHKAALRALRGGGAHVLTMTATPIPRTLQSALAGIQELSVIATPPVRRQPVRTYVLPFDAGVAREALLREKARGGRSFFVCPRIADIGPMAEELARIVPELDVAAAHGRIRAEELDGIVLAFADGAHDVLLTTAIIETGLDIPGADTMIVWRPERFGIAQLHQLRGRVGRGRARAACYLLHDPAEPLPPATEQRLRTLEAFEGLGAGFAIGARDLDLRGAGDLMGEDQAGHVRLIGTELYQHLLARALAEARGEPAPEEWTPELRLGVGVAVPAAYVPEPEVRLDLYARLARLAEEAGIDDLAEEIDDRFGPPPPEVERMLAVGRLRLRCRALGVAKLEVGPKAVAATFRDGHSPPAGAVGDGVPGAPRRSGERLVLDRESATPDERLAAAAALLDALGGG